MSALNPQTDNASHQNTLADLMGLEVYTASGVYVGQVEDARIDFGVRKASGLALTKVNPEVIPQAEDLSDKRGIVIPYRWIQSAHDVVVVTDVFERLKQVAPVDGESPLSG